MAFLVRVERTDVDGFVSDVELDSLSAVTIRLDFTVRLDAVRNKNVNSFSPKT